MMLKIKENFTIFFFIAIITILTAFFIASYCEIFYQLGISAKNRMVENPLYAFVATPIFFWISAYICRRFAINASGNSLTHIKSSLDQLNKTPNSYDKISNLLSLRIVIVNAISSMISTFGGGSLGREGPSVQMSASIFAVAAHKLRKFFPKINLQNWVFAGCGVGFAVAFCAPFTGFIYVAEKLFKIKPRNFSSNIIWTFLVIIIVGAIMYEVLPLFVVGNINFVISEEVFLIFFIAIFCAILAVFFLKIGFYFYKRVIEIKSSFWHLVPIIIGLLVSIVSFFGGVYSIGGGIKTVNDMLASDVAFISSAEVFGRIVNTILTLIAGCAGGLVAPAIAIGAGIGSIFSVLMENIDAKIFILCGMTSFLTVVMNMPLTAAIIILETTSQSVFAFPFLFSSALISFFSSKLIYKFKDKISGKFFQ